MDLTLEVSFQVLVHLQFVLLTSSSQRMLFLYKNQPNVYQSHLRESLKMRFIQLNEKGIIYKLDRNTATEWMNSFIIVKKPNGDLRICLDLTDLNKYIVRPVCNSNTLDEISFKFKNAEHFSVFDATKEFFHLPLLCRFLILLYYFHPIDFSL